MGEMEPEELKEFLKSVEMTSVEEMKKEKEKLINSINKLKLTSKGQNEAQVSSGEIQIGQKRKHEVKRDYLLMV